MNKDHLCQTLLAEREAWEALLTEIGEGRMEVPGVVGVWSVKDLVAHLTAWEKRPAAWLAAAQRGDKPTPAPWSRDLDEEQVNAWIYESNKYRMLDDVLEESRTVFDQIMQGLEALTQESLSDPHRFEWLNGIALIEAMPGNTFEHYRDHAEMIRQWLNSRPS
ncbi:MAG: ClbS/DfsB family four-helix bundle protein [Chloroflexi bacterium]|nr:ClbS/DfsB family four-helix bundle protein [Chloroflexota bacterium]